MEKNTYQKILFQLKYSNIPFLLLCTIAVYCVIWSFTGMWPWKDNIYNSYVLQADAWCHGRFDLGRNYTYLELACYHGKYYVSFPPFPSILLLPFVFVFGLNTPDGFIACITILVGTTYTYKLLKCMGKSNKASLFWTLFLIIGTNVLFITVNSWVWFFAQNLSFTLSMMAIYYAKKGKGGISLFLWAASVGCRPFQILYLPILLLLLYQHCNGKKQDVTIPSIIEQKLHWMIAPIIVAICYMLLNYFRFDNVFEFGHNYLPEFMEAKKGQFDLSYISTNIKSLYLLPKVADNGMLIYPKFNGMSIWIVSPIFISYFFYLIYAIFRRRKKEILFQLLTISIILLHLIILTAHKTMGGLQFGNRYTCDVLPYLFYSLALLIPKKDKLEKYNYPLFFIGLSLNLVGTIAVFNNWI